MSKSFEDIYRGINYDLVNHYEQGVLDERNRIVRLLAENQHLYSAAAAWAIALITEEK